MPEPEKPKLSCQQAYFSGGLKGDRLAAAPYPARLQPEVPRERALDYVAGYCLGLDMTVRGREDRSFRKSIDGYAVLGPWMVTAD